MGTLFKYIGEKTIKTNDFIGSKEFEECQQCNFCNRIERGHPFWSWRGQHVCPDCYSKGKRIKSEQELRKEEIELFAKEHNLTFEQAELAKFGKKVIKEERKKERKERKKNFKQNLMLRIVSKLVTTIGRKDAFPRAIDIVSRYTQEECQQFYLSNTFPKEISE